MFGNMGGGYYYDGGGHWVWMALMMILVVGGVIALGIWAVRATTQHAPAATDPALEVLRRRLASGEITQDDYEKTSRILKG